MLLGGSTSSTFITESGSNSIGMNDERSSVPIDSSGDDGMLLSMGRHATLYFAAVSSPIPADDSFQKEASFPTGKVLCRVANLSCSNFIRLKKSIDL